MKKISIHRAARCALAVTGIALASQAFAQVTFYEREGFQGRSFRTDQPVRDLQRYGFNDRASSVVVESDRWQVCEDARYDGRCVVLQRGRYPSLASMGLNDRVSSLREVDARADRGHPVPGSEASRITLYANTNFRGRAVTADETSERLRGLGRYGRAASVVVVGRPWQVCEDASFAGRCEVLRPGRYASVESMGLNEPVQSVREVQDLRDRRHDRADDDHDRRPAGLAEFRRRGGERLYEAHVTSVRAVVGPPQQRCWVEREQVGQNFGGANVPGAVVGALIGGILGHQVGGGTGRDVATAGGAVAGAALGANVGRGDATAQTRDVQRCANTPASNDRPDYWDVTYEFRGREHHVQMTAPPQGATLTVNADGEPRS